MSYAELSMLSNRVALGFLELGIRAGDVVTVQLPNRAEFAVCLVACHRIGVVLNPIPVIMGSRELQIMLTLAESRLLVVADQHRGVDFVALADQARQNARYPEHVVIVGDPGSSGFLPWESLARAGSVSTSSLRYMRPDANSVMLLAFTSGTTGTPKGVMHTPNTLLSNVEATARRRRWGPETITLMGFQVGHAAGYLWGVLMPLWVGGTAVYVDPWDIGKALSVIRAARVTQLHIPGPWLTELFNLAGPIKEVFPSLRQVVISGTNISEDLKLRLQPFHPMHGFAMTENGVSTSTDETSSREQLFETDGYPLDGVEIRIVDDSGSEVPAEVPGRLLVRSPYNFVGYSQGRTFTQQFLHDGDWFATGDVALMRADGYLRWTGRLKDIIRRGGENIPVREVEELIGNYARVREVALVPVTDKRYGERVCACVIRADADDLTLDELRSYLQRRGVTKQFWPEYLEIFDDFPRSVLGKPQKHALRAAVAARIGRRRLS